MKEHKDDLYNVASLLYKITNDWYLKHSRVLSLVTLIALFNCNTYREVQEHLKEKYGEIPIGTIRKRAERAFKWLVQDIQKYYETKTPEEK